MGYQSAIHWGSALYSDFPAFRNYFLFSGWVPFHQTLKNILFQNWKFSFPIYNLLKLLQKGPILLYFLFFSMGKARVFIKPHPAKNTTWVPAVWWKMFLRRSASNKRYNLTWIPARSVSQQLPHIAFYPTSRNEEKIKLSSAKELPAVEHAAGIWRALPTVIAFSITRIKKNEEQTTNPINVWVSSLPKPSSFIFKLLQWK